MYCLYARSVYMTFTPGGGGRGGCVCVMLLSNGGRPCVRLCVCAAELLVWVASRGTQLTIHWHSAAHAIVFRRFVLERCTLMGKSSVCRQPAWNCWIFATTISTAGTFSRRAMHNYNFGSGGEEWRKKKNEKGANTRGNILNFSWLHSSSSSLAHPCRD